jgi:Ca2+-dependent lipid-binding protein
MPTSLGGFLHLSILKAELLRNTEYLGEMDPFMVVTYNGLVQKTPALQDAGKTPEWNISLEPIPVSSMGDNILF